MVTNTTTNSSTYALTAGGTLTTVGLPGNLNINVSGAVQINTTGASDSTSINTPGGVVNLNFASGAVVRTFAGSGSLTVGTFASLTGNFSFSSVNTGTQTKVYIGINNLSGSANDGTYSASISNGTLGVVVYWNNIPALSPGYALFGTVTASVAASAGSAGTLTGTGTVSIAQNTTAAAVSETVTVGTTSVPITFTTTQAANPSTGLPYQQVTLVSASANLDSLWRRRQPRGLP